MLASDGLKQPDEDMGFLLDVQLCETLHCLPSQLDAEDSDRIEELRLYFQAKGRAMKRKQAHADAQAKQGRR